MDEMLEEMVKEFEEYYYLHITERDIFDYIFLNKDMIKDKNNQKKISTCSKSFFEDLYTSGSELVGMFIYKELKLIQDYEVRINNLLNKYKQNKEAMADLIEAKEVIEALLMYYIRNSSKWKMQEEKYKFKLQIENF